MALFGFSYKPRNDAGREALYKWKEPLSDGQLTYLRNDMLLPLVFVLRPLIPNGKGETMREAVFNFWTGLF